MRMEERQVGWFGTSGKRDSSVSRQGDVLWSQTEYKSQLREGSSCVS